MEIPENLIEYIQEEARKISHGQIVIEIAEDRNHVGVTVQRRLRFETDIDNERRPASPSQYRQDKKST